MLEKIPSSVKREPIEGEEPRLVRSHAGSGDEFEVVEIGEEEERRRRLEDVNGAGCTWRRR